MMYQTAKTRLAGTYLDILLTAYRAMVMSPNDGVGRVCSMVLYSRISSTVCFLIFDETAPIMVRMAWAVRPCLPITLPMSSLAGIRHAPTHQRPMAVSGLKFAELGCGFLISFAQILHGRIDA